VATVPYLKVEDENGNLHDILGNIKILSLDFGTDELPSSFGTSNSGVDAAQKAFIDKFFDAFVVTSVI
jgi:hypothetical protein